MYTESRWRDALLMVRATLSNQLARRFPALYVVGTGQTGRGREDVDPDKVAAYYYDCAQEYLQRLPLEPGAPQPLAGRSVLEYGPGDTLGVALLLYAYGAADVHCVDRFPLQRQSSAVTDVYARLLARLDGIARTRAAEAFMVPGDPASGFRREAIEYHVTPDGLIQQHACYDLVLSRSVLEHVNDLPATLRDIAAALKPEGVSLHKVDLKSHGLDRYRELDFLTWPDGWYDTMYGAKGFPNRHRLDDYRRLVPQAGLTLGGLDVVDATSDEVVDFIRPFLPERFRHKETGDLRALSFWMRLHTAAGKRVAA